ncbi:MAG: hypothetical protein JO153_14360 [Solirubrobacterales bacterium]|nr:hypothetical protein [Solirubrobacterales bacterium]
MAIAFRSLFHDVLRASGGGEEEVAQFFACGMLINVTTALELPEIAAPILDVATG